MEKKKIVKEILSTPKEDRRILSHVPDPDNLRKLYDRRGMKNLEHGFKEGDPTSQSKQRVFSRRYVADFEVEVRYKKEKYKVKAVDISTTGILVECLTENEELFQLRQQAHLKFAIPPGCMPEGFNSKVKVKAIVVRTFTKTIENTSKLLIAFQFETPLTDYFHKKKWSYSVSTASGFLFLAILLVMLMRAESIIYFKFNSFLYLYSIIAAVFLLSRYLFGALYRNVKINNEFTPGVSIIIPCFNEEEWIHRTILSCIDQEYPIDKLEVIVVDDCSNDRSVEQIKKTFERIQKEDNRFATKDRMKLIVLPQNAGKREALVKGVEVAKHDLVTFVDSDSFLDPSAIKHLVQPFQDPKMGGVSGRTDVENKYTNIITKLQTVRYYIAFRIMKAAESYFDCVTCLSGPLACYRKDLVIKHSKAWLNQKFLGHPATFGDDRSMTNFILQTHRTTYQDQAICSTIVPSDKKVFLKQQMRWKRSWLRESLRAAGFIWKKEPFMALFFYIGFIVPIVAPIIVVYNLIYVPFVYKVFPGTFLVGLLLMAALMSLAHLLYRKSDLWIYGFVFCLFYEFVLLWQMPVAWVTFWKSTWGTRETPQDIEERLKKEKRKTKRSIFKFASLTKRKQEQSEDGKCEQEKNS